MYMYIIVQHTVHNVLPSTWKILASTYMSTQFDKKKTEIVSRVAEPLVPVSDEEGEGNFDDERE